ncbi:MAG: hypothetical protein U0703_24390 [Anaerolineae bacterium]
MLVARLRERRYAACFAHMMPLFAVMGAPLLRGVPITPWYTHRQAHRTLQLATAVSRRVVTAAPDSFPADRVAWSGTGSTRSFSRRMSVCRSGSDAGRRPNVADRSRRSADADQASGDADPRHAGCAGSARRVRR